MKGLRRCGFMALLIFALALCPAQGAGASDESADSGKTRFKFSTDEKLWPLCRGVQNTLECARKIEGHQLERSRGEVKRVGKTLRIRAGRKTVTLTDKEPESPDAVLYSYLEYIPRIHYHLVHVQFWEGCEFMLISNRTGRQYYVHDVPIFSFDPSRFLTVPADEAYGPNGFFMWRVTPRGIVSEFAYDPSEEILLDYAVFEFVSWPEKGRVKLRKFTYADKEFCPDDSFMLIDVEARLVRGKWVLVDQKKKEAIRCGERQEGRP